MDYLIPVSWKGLVATRTVRRSTLAPSIVAIAFTLISFTNAYAAIKTWSGGNGTWDYSAANWSGSTFASGDSAVFGGTAGTVTIGQNINVSAITFDTAGYVIDASGGSASANYPTLTNSTTLTVNQNATIKQRIEGSSGFIKEGSARLVVQPPAGDWSGRRVVTYSGNRIVNGGQLWIDLNPGNADRQFAGATWYINNGSQIRVYGPTNQRHIFNGSTWEFGNAGGGTLDVDNINFIVRNMTVRTTGGAKNTFTGSGGSGMNGQSSTDAVTFDVAPGTDSGGVDLEFSGRARTMKLTKTGAGLARITSTVNEISVGTQIDGGTLEIGGNGRIGSGSYSRTIVNNGTFGHNSTANQAISGVISGSGRLAKGNTGALTLTNANTFSGGTLFTRGTINVAESDALGTGTVTMEGNQQPSLRISQNATVPNPIRVGVLSSDIVDKVAEASSYEVVYDLNIEANGNYSEAVPYSLDRSALMNNFTRIAYFLELDGEWVWVSMDAFTDNIKHISLPYSALGVMFDQKVTNMNVVGSSGANVVNGTGITTGNIEMWPGNYSKTANDDIGGDTNDYDFDDAGGSVNNGYSCFQVHNHGASQTIFAYNRWGNNGSDDLGIGNNTPGSPPDYTFAGNASTYASKRLRILVLPSSPVWNSSNTAHIRANAGVSGTFSGDIELNSTYTPSLTVWADDPGPELALSGTISGPGSIRYNHIYDGTGGEVHGTNTYEGITQIYDDGRVKAMSSGAFSTNWIYHGGDGQPSLRLANGVVIPNPWSTRLGLNTGWRDSSGIKQGFVMDDGAAGAEYAGDIYNDEPNDAVWFPFYVSSPSVMNISGDLGGAGGFQQRADSSDAGGKVLLTGDNTSMGDFIHDAGHLIIGSPNAMPAVAGSYTGGAGRKVKIINNGPTLNLDEVQVFDGSYLVANVANIARSGAATATQSTDFSGSYPASKAIDGNLGSFSHTAGNDPGWWQVDLGADYDISTIVIHARGGYEWRLSNYTVQVLSATDEVLWQSTGNPVPPTDTSMASHHVNPKLNLRAKFATTYISANEAGGNTVSRTVYLDQSNTGYVNGSNDLTFSGDLKQGSGTYKLRSQLPAGKELVFSGNIAPASGNQGIIIGNEGAGTVAFRPGVGKSQQIRELQSFSGVIEIQDGSELILASNGATYVSTTGAYADSTIRGGTLVLDNDNTKHTGGNHFYMNNQGSGRLTVLSKIKEKTAAGWMLNGITTSANGEIALFNAANDFRVTRIVQGNVVVSNMSALGRDSIEFSNQGGIQSRLVYVGEGETTDKGISVGDCSVTNSAIYASGSGELILSGTGQVVNYGAVSPILEFAGTSLGRVEGGALSSSGAYPLSIIKSGTGTWHITGTQAYQGATTINNGRLKIEGMTHTGPGAWAVNPGGILSGGSGGGSINGALSVYGILSPGEGDNTGTITANGGVSWYSTDTPGPDTDWQFRLSGGSNDLLDISGNFTKVGSGNFRFDFGGDSLEGEYTIVEWTGSTTFSLEDFTAIGLQAGQSATFGFVGNRLVVSVTSCSVGPTITLGTFPAACGNVSYLGLPYSATTLSPNRYTIDYDATANAAGFVDVSARQPLGIINDVFSYSSVSKTSCRHQDDDIDFGWFANYGCGTPNSSWEVAGGVLRNANPSASSTVDAEGSVVQTVSLAGRSGTSIDVSFDYTHATGNDTLGVVLLGHVGTYDLNNEFLGNLQTVNGSYGYVNGNADEGTAYNLLNGTANSHVNYVTLTGSGTYSTSIDVAALGISGVTDVAAFDYFTIAFTRDNADSSGNAAVTIDNLIVTSRSLPIDVPDAVAIGTYNGTLTVFSTNNCSSTTNFTVTITDQPPNIPGSISGPSPICASATGLTYSISRVTSATGYVWTVPLGVVVTATNVTQTQITVDWNNAGNGNIGVTAKGVCGDSSGARTKAIVVDAAAPNAPTALSATNVTQSSFYANWTTLASADGYYYDMATTPDFEAASMLMSNENWTIPSKSTRYHQVPVGTYFYRVRAYNTCGISPYSGVVTVSVNQVLAKWDTSTQSGGAGNYGPSPLATYYYNAQYITVTGLTRGAGVSVAGTGLADGWGGEGWDAVDQAAAEAAGDYITFTIMPKDRVNINYAAFDEMNLLVEASGPTDGVLQYSLDNGANFVDIVSLAYSELGSGGAYASLPIDLSIVSALQGVSDPVTFRFVNWGASSAGGDWYIYDVNASTDPDLQVLGGICLDPVVFNVTGGGAKCDPGGTPVAIGLSGSESNVLYTLFKDGVSSSEVYGDGDALDFGDFSESGDYTIQATRISTESCSVMMYGTATVTVATTPGIPANVSATFNNGTGAIDLSWDSVGGATAYDIYRVATISGSGHAFLTSVVATAHSDATVVRNNITYYYLVYASSGNGLCVSDASSEVNAQTDELCQPGLAPTLTQPASITVNPGSVGTVVITATDSSSSCGQPTITQYPSPLPSYITNVADSGSAPSRTRTYTIAPQAGDNGAAQPIRVVTYDADGNTNEYTFMVYVGSSAQSNFKVQITDVSEATPGATADVTFDSTTGIKYDVYTSTEAPGSGGAWTRSQAGVSAAGTETTTELVGDGQMRFYQVTPAGISPNNNGVHGIVRPALPANKVTFISPPLPETASDLQFNGNLGAALAAVLTDPADRVYVMAAGAGSYTTLRLVDGAWIVDGGGLYNTPLNPGQGFAVLRGNGSTSPTFTGAVGNDGGSTVTLKNGYNLIGISEGRSLDAATAFENASPVGNYNSAQADEVYVQNPNGSWRRLWRLGNNLWYDTTAKGDTTLELVPGQAYYYIRKGADTDLDF